jgi:signal transduction histidine kinase
VVLVLHDLTELKRLEAGRRDFVASVSHELKTPLTAIAGFAETLLDGTLEVTRNGAHVADIGPGGFAGEMALLTDRHRNSRVVAKTDATLLHIDGRGFTHLLDDVPHLAVKLLPIVAARVAED